MKGKRESMKFKVTGVGEQKKKYKTPRLTTFGKFQELTLLPGGSVSTEGGSGKGHFK